MGSQPLGNRAHSRGNLSSDSAAEWAFGVKVAIIVAFAATIAVLGGSARTDQVQIVALRPLAALFLIPALYLLKDTDWSKARPLLYMLGALAGWMLIQLIPLPPFVWHMLPGRESIAAMDAAIGLEDTWRPISLSPFRGWNALASLIIPMLGLVLAVALRIPSGFLLMIIAGLGIADAALGLLQVAAGPRSPLYFYALTNTGSPVGLFANENHSAVFSACSLVVLAQLGASQLRAKGNSAAPALIAAAYLLVLLAALGSGSRAGALTTLLALAGSAALVWLSISKKTQDKRKVAKALPFEPSPKLLAIAAIGTLAALVGAFFALQGAPGLSDAVARDTFEDLRFAILPTLIAMIETYWLFGAGFGSFEEVYHIFEPADLLLPSYVNQAHNDWAQVIIEGGVPVIAIIAALVVWIFRQMQGLAGNGISSFAARLAWLSLFMIIAIASVVDYPLRAPLFQLVAIWLLVALAFEPRAASDHATGS